MTAWITMFAEVLWLQKKRIHIQSHVWVQQEDERRRFNLGFTGWVVNWLKWPWLDLFECWFRGLRSAPQELEYVRNKDMESQASCWGCEGRNNPLHLNILQPWQAAKCFWHLKKGGWGWTGGDTNNWYSKGMWMYIIIQYFQYWTQTKNIETQRKM